jgi:predicted enzyme related to lactoylglutathione lyase
MGSPPGYDVRDVWSIYLATDDAQKTVETAAANGGRVVEPPMQIAELGTQAIIEGPDGARVGVWQPDAFHGLSVLGEPNTPVWFELHTRSYEAAVRFYREVFRVHTEVQSDSPEFRYTIAKDGDQDVAGFMDDTVEASEGAPSQWTLYFGSDDVDAAVAKIVSLGGSVLQSAEDTPYGRLATAADPMGAHFRLQGPNKAPIAS